MKMKIQSVGSKFDGFGDEEFENHYQEPPESYFGKFKRNWALHFGYLIFIYGFMVSASIVLLCFYCSTPESPTSPSVGFNTDQLPYTSRAFDDVAEASVDPEIVCDEPEDVEEEEDVEAATAAAKAELPLTQSDWVWL